MGAGNEELVVFSSPLVRIAKRRTDLKVDGKDIIG